MITRENYNRAADFIRNHGRPLEKALLEHEFYGAPIQPVLDALAAFGNSDGGFGRALEADFRAEESSVLCTTYAVDLMIELGIEAGNELLQGAAAYLNSQFDAERKLWRYVPEAPQDYPHAPWWNNSRLEETFGGFLENPRVKIISYMLLYPELFDRQRAELLLQEVLVLLRSRTDDISKDSLHCWVLLLESGRLGPEVSAELEEKLRAMIKASVETDSSKWGEYCMKPVDAVTSPDSPFAELLGGSLAESLEWEAAAQMEDGSWAPNWNWAGVYPGEWKKAGLEWSGVLTIGRLKLFKAFGMIA